MRIPFISRGSHAEVVGLLMAQIDELSQERKVLLDRLATLALGGPLFSTPAAAPPEEVEELEASASEVEQLLRLRRRPSQLAGALTRKAHRDQYKRPSSASAITAALDQAEAAGKI